ncbi:hypothetical protein BJ322DRAFT_1017837 [Thelephora terrestris]|uniref:Uncharacterized protein n=1 Tax=Thelephora terrestris TaxID=56493 RepID=A0A9P6HPD8_9AGAM|nr:hypothetical protein BJ322DRAFT_1017837 [Thelephora terrestris]
MSSDLFVQVPSEPLPQGTSITAKIVSGPSPIQPPGVIELQDAFHRVLQSGLASLPEDGPYDAETPDFNHPGTTTELITNLAFDHSRAVDFRSHEDLFCPLNFSEPHWGVEFGRPGDIEYMVRIPENWDPTDSKARSIGFLHGLGFGIIHYSVFIIKLLQSHRIFHPTYVQPLGRRSMAEGIFGTMREYGFVPEDNESREVTAGDQRTGVTVPRHSNGSFTHAWMLKAFPRLISRSCFIDPVMFCLREGDICYNFLYKIRKTASQTSFPDISIDHGLARGTLVNVFFRILQSLDCRKPQASGSSKFHPDFRLRRIGPKDLVLAAVQLFWIIGIVDTSAALALTTKPSLSVKQEAGQPRNTAFYSRHDQDDLGKINTRSPPSSSSDLCLSRCSRSFGAQITAGQALRPPKTAPFDRLGWVDLLPILPLATLVEDQPKHLCREG